MIARFAVGAAVLTLSFIAALAGIESATAQTWPTRPVKFIVSLGPGSGTDVSARLLADRLPERWGQPVVVENRPGGDGVVAINAFIGARDDHTLLFTPTSSFTAHPYQHDKLPYDPRELSPVARVSTTILGIRCQPLAQSRVGWGLHCARSRAARQAELLDWNRADRPDL